MLMLSELATNAVQHAATEFEVAVHVAPDGQPRAGRGQRRRRRLPDAAGAGRRRAARARPAHRAHAGRRLGHRDAARPARQDGVVLVAAGGGRRDGRPLAGPSDAAGGGCVRSAGPRGTAPADRWPRGRAGDGRRCRPRPSQPAWPVQGVRVVLDGLRDAVVATDDQGVIRYVNRCGRGPAGLAPRRRWSAGRSSTSCPIR